jgi:Flp pilus assembly protein TadG
MAGRKSGLKNSFPAHQNKMKKEISITRRRRQKGSDIVEFGLTVLPLFGFIFLTLDVSWMIFAQITLQSAVRDGVRYAVTGQVMSGMGQDASIKTVVQNSAVGFLAGTNGANQIAINYFLPGSMTPTQSNAGGNVVQVSIQGFALSPLGPILHSGTAIDISAVASDIVQPPANGIPPTR